MKLIQGGKKDPAINDQDWKFIKTSLRQCIATKFITESEKEAILNYLETIEEADLIRSRETILGYEHENFNQAGEMREGLKQFQELWSKVSECELRIGSSCQDPP